MGTLLQTQKIEAGSDLTAIVELLYKYHSLPGYGFSFFVYYLKQIDTINVRR